MIEFIDIHKSFGEHQVLRGVSISVDTGRVLVICGTSGAGKSVLVKQLIGLMRPDAGRIVLDGQDVTHLGEELADVFLYLVRLADKCEVDLGAAVQRKLAKNAAKYPAELCKGSSKK